MQTVASAPALAAEAAREMDVETIRPYLLALGLRLDVAAKIAQAEAFSRGYKGSSLAIPSKLVGTSHVQDALADLAAARAESGKRFTPCTLTVVPVPETEDGEGVVVHDATSRLALGLIQRKHLAWFLPLIPYGAEVYVSAVTGGPATGEGFRFYGCNIAFVGVADAIRAMHRAADVEALEATMEAAYASGDPARVAAATALLEMAEATYTPTEAEAAAVATA